MKNKNKSDVWNLIFSAFLVTAFMVCSNFFIGMINDSFERDAVKKTLLTAVIFVLFGLVLFYATRVGDGKQVIRFSAATLILMVLPALYVILASVIPSMPFHEPLSSHPEVINIAAVIMGYGLPYTFLSGYELDREKDNGDVEQEEKTQEETGEEISDGEQPADEASEKEAENAGDDDTASKEDTAVEEGTDSTEKAEE